MPAPYIGITDFTTISEVDRMCSVFATHSGNQKKRRLHVGVMMSYKTLNNLPTKWTDAFPKKETITSIFAREDTFNCLHYADYDAIAVEQNLTQAIAWGGDGMTALQLDMVWPDPNSVERALNTADCHIDLVLQVGANALRAVDDNPREMVLRLRSYYHLDYILLDKSMGRGLGMDAVGLLPYARAIRDNFPNVGIVVAGGLGPTSMHLVEPLLEEFPDISIDAQGRLRPSGNALDPIDWDMAAEYLRQALATLP
jgi:hypothetical protein